MRRSASASPVGPKASATSSTSVSSIPEQTSVSGASPAAARWPAQSLSRLPVRFATTVRRDRRRPLPHVDPLDRHLDAVRLRVRLRGLQRGELAVAAGDRRPAELGRGDPEHAAAGAPVGDRAGGLAGLLQLDQQREAEPGRRMAAGAEGAARVDHDVDQPVLRVPPGRAHADPARHLDRAVEVGPAIRPVVRDRGGRDVDEAPPGGRLDLTHVRDLAGRAVDRELDPARPALLLEPVRRELEQVRHHRLRVLRSAANREADHLR